MNHDLSLSIVIVNWNTGPELRTCLQSLVVAGREVALVDVIVVDNGSSDDSLHGLPDGELALQIVRNTENRGFAAACNQGARLARGRLLLFLNPDTRLQPDSLSTPVQWLGRPANDRVGICGIQLVREDGSVSPDCWRFPTLVAFCSQILGVARLAGGAMPGLAMTGWDHGSTRDVDHVIGAFYMVRREVFDALEGFDERFFVYFEDLDFSLRSHQLGWRTVYLPTARACHVGGVSSGKVRARRLFYSLRSRFRYAFKHWNAGQAWALVLMSLLVEPLTRLAWCAARGEGRDMVHTLRAYLMLYGRLPGLLRGARSA
ncbi:MAG: glycosyl transferase [Paucimonas sp.]|nr:glycosyl transferase [Paucimonas sp.]